MGGGARAGFPPASEQDRFQQIRAASRESDELGDVKAVMKVENGQPLQAKIDTGKEVYAGVSVLNSNGGIFRNPPFGSYRPQCGPLQRGKQSS
jgi:hypothetical protein